MQDGNSKPPEELESEMVSFNEISSKIQDTSKTSSVKKKLNPYKVEYFKNNNEGNQNLR